MRKTQSKNRKKKTAPPPPSKFVLYENSVQSPRWQVDYLPQFHEWLTGRKATRLREDFCGTGRIACEWVKKSPRHRALGLDLDPETLAYAEAVNASKLPESARKRLEFRCADVRKTTREKFDLIGAFNFSFFIFRERAEMLRYARSVRESLGPKGTFFLELAGGHGFLDEMRESRDFRVRGYGKVKYVWEQHEFDPIRSVSDYSIHFKLPDGTWLNDAFTYHWRIWGIRELREILYDAGFKRSVVLWETCDRKGDGTGEYLLKEDAEHAHAWIAYVVGVK